MKKYAGLIFAWMLAAVCAATAAPEGSLRVFLMDARFLAATKQRIQDGDKNLAPAVAQLEEDAQKALSAGPFSIVNKKLTPPSGDKHDYMSMAPYFWPNPATSNGLPYIRRDGEVNPELSRIPDHHNMDQMAGAVETLALAYYYKGDEKYAARAAEDLRAWFIEPATRMNPSLQYAQFISGVNTGRGIGIIESRSLTRVVDAVGLLAGSKAWTDGDDRAVKDWFASYLKWMQESANGRAENAAKNNHGTYYDVQATSFALFLGRQDLAAEILKTARTKRIALQIQRDGREPLELVRTKAWSYSVGNLSGLMLLARMGDELGVDLWNFRTEDGRCIRAALDYLVPFAVDGKKWPDQQIGGWPPQMLFPLIRQAALKFPDQGYGALLAKIPNVDSTNRVNLLNPKPPVPKQARLRDEIQADLASSQP